jgi:hypothetical protein
LRIDMLRRSFYRMILLVAVSVISVGCSDTNSAHQPTTADILTAISEHQYTKVVLSIDSLDVIWSATSLRQDNPFNYQQTYSSTLNTPRHFIQNTLDLQPAGVKGFSDVQLYISLRTEDTLAFHFYGAGRGVSSGANEMLDFVAPYVFEVTTGAIHVSGVPASILSKSFAYKYYRWDKNKADSDEIIGIDPAEHDALVSLDISRD